MLVDLCISMWIIFDSIAMQMLAGENNAETRDRTGDLQIFSLTLSQLSYRGLIYGYICINKRNGILWF